jgi:hypothetical protein
MESDTVVLARILPGASPTLDPAFQPVIARPLARPQLASGQTVPGNTPWELWDEGDVSVGVQTTIDTSTAGFTTKPNYFAEAITDQSNSDFVPAWFTSIADPQADSFILRLFMRRITREGFDIVSPLTQVAKTPSGGKISLASGNIFVQYDWVARLLPTASAVSVITGLTGTTATLDNPLPGLSAATTVAFGNPPRLANVTKVTSEVTGMTVSVDTPGNFQTGKVVAKLGPIPATSRPTTIADIDDAGDLSLANPITDLKTGDSLGVAQTSSLVVAAAGTTVTVQNPELFSVNDTVVCVDSPVENFTPAQITGVAGANNEILTLSPMIAGINGLHVAVLKQGGTVQSVDSSAGEVKIQVDQPKLFRAGDMVAKVLPGGSSSEPVRVNSVHSSSKSLTLESNIAGLNLNDTIGAADYRVRGTVIRAANGGATITVANATIFPLHSFVAQLDDSYAAVAVATVTASAGTLLTLSPAMPSLQSGSILALCSMPVTVSVQGIDQDGTIHVDTPGLISAGDVVGSIPAHSGIAIVAASNESLVKLADTIPGLTEGDALSIVTMSGTVNVTPGTSAGKVVLDANNRARVGDFLANVTGWREPGPVRSISFVTGISGTDLTLFSPIDGLMVNDNIGAASLAASSVAWIQLRLKELPADLTPGNEALLVGLDRLQGQTASMFAFVEAIDHTRKIVLLRVENTSGAAIIRPEDLAASVLLTSGSPLDLLRNQNVYVSWFACQNPDPMPRPCPTQTTTLNPCGSSAS